MSQDWDKFSLQEAIEKRDKYARWSFYCFCFSGFCGVTAISLLCIKTTLEKILS